MAEGTLAEVSSQSASSDLENVLVVITECPTSAKALSCFMHNKNGVNDLDQMRQNLKVRLESN
jgi:hypothetical protein